MDVPSDGDARHHLEIRSDLGGFLPRPEICFRFDDVVDEASANLGHFFAPSRNPATLPSYDGGGDEESGRNGVVDARKRLSHSSPDNLLDPAQVKGGSKMGSYMISPELRTS